MCVKVISKCKILMLYLESSFEEKTPDQDFNRRLQDNEALYLFSIT